MGEVYRARDSRLQREVAIKVLPEQLASDPERLARFTREAQTLAALNHANIAQVHGLEESGDIHALIMELVEGEDLAQRIARGPLPLDEALPIARQIADALEAAHDSGIVHRDLKPANIRIRPDGTVKVLDFGLAKALEPTSTATGPAALMNSPTLTQQATQLGVILGSAGYMAPEQARGRPVDRRADIWAFGVVLYEMLTGRRAFEGEEITDVLASVLKSDPDLGSIPADTPASVRRLLRRCLVKDPRQRLSSIRDARLELDELEPASGGVAPSLASVSASAPPRVARLAPFLAVALVSVLATAAVAWMMMRSSPPPADASVLSRLSITAPPGKTLFADTSGISLSPDGRKIAFLVGTIVGAQNELWVRSLDSTTAQRIESGDEVQFTFWSPDSRRLGFFTTGHLKTVAAEGGRAQILAATEGGRGADWNRADQILYAPAPEGPLMRISANGGDPVAVTTLDTARGESSHRFPAFLPDGDHFLFAALPARGGKFEIYASSLSEPAKRTRIGAMESAPRWINTGWLLFARRGILAVQRFDPDATATDRRGARSGRRAQRGLRSGGERHCGTFRRRLEHRAARLLHERLEQYAGGPTGRHRPGDRVRARSPRPIHQRPRFPRRHAGDPGAVGFADRVHPLASRLGARQRPAGIDRRRPQRVAGVVAGRQPFRLLLRSGRPAEYLHEAGRGLVARDPLLPLGSAVQERRRLVAGWPLDHTPASRCGKPAEHLAAAGVGRRESGALRAGTHARAQRRRRHRTASGLPTPPGTPAASRSMSRRSRNRVAACRSRAAADSGAGGPPTAASSCTCPKNSRRRSG